MDQLIEIATHPATWAVIGILVKTLAPAWVPILGIGKKLVEELTQLHEENGVKNERIQQYADKTGKKIAAKHLKKKLK